MALNLILCKKKGRKTITQSVTISPFFVLQFDATALGFVVETGDVVRNVVIS